jgi:hypothetical protein
MAKKQVLDEEELRRQMTGAIPVFVPPVSNVPPVPEQAPTPPPPPPPTVPQPTLDAAAKDDTENDAGYDDTILPTITERRPSTVQKEEGDKDLLRYDKVYLGRNIVGSARTNVGISADTLLKVERVVNRLFDGRIAASTFVDNVVFDHLMRHEKLYNKWLAEKPGQLFL